MTNDDFEKLGDQGAGACSRALAFDSDDVALNPLDSDSDWTENLICARHLNVHRDVTNRLTYETRCI